MLRAQMAQGVGIEVYNISFGMDVLRHEGVGAVCMGLQQGNYL